MDDSLYTIKEYASMIRLSSSTVYRNPAKYYMFRVGSSWRANKESLKKFEQAQFNDNNVYRLALVGSKRKTKCQYTKEAASIGSMYPPQLARELDALLAPQTK